MKYFVLTEDELQPSAEETIYVFDHAKTNQTIHTIEDFAVKCLFIVLQNTYMYWYQEWDEKALSIPELERRVRKELHLVNDIPKDDAINLKERFADTIRPFGFPERIIRCSYAYEPVWNDTFLLIEGEEKYFGIHYLTGA